MQEERFHIAEKTFCTGGPGENKDYNYGIIEGSHKYLKEIRSDIVKGDIAKADQLVSNHFKGDYDDFGAFSSVGHLNDMNYRNCLLHHKESIYQFIKTSK